MDTKAFAILLSGLDQQSLYSLQVAALLGDTFSLDHVLELTNIKPSKLLVLLDEMLKLGVMGEKLELGKGNYCFITPNAIKPILKSMTDEQKISCQSGIIDYLERNLPDDENKPIILSERYLRFRGRKQDPHYMKKAADHLIAGHKTAEALILYDKIITGLLGKDRNTLEDMLLIESVMSYAPIAVNLHPAEKIFPLIEKSILIAEARKNIRARAMLELCLGHLHQSQGNSLNASPHYDEGWRLAQGTGDQDLIRTASKFFALSLFWQGKLEEAIHMYEITLGNVEQISPDLRDLWANLMLAHCYGKTGRVARGVGLAEAIRERAAAKNHLKTQGYAHAVIAAILLEARQIEDAEPHIRKALSIGETTGSDLILRMAKACRAYEYFSKGNLPEAKRELVSAIHLAMKLGQHHHPSSLIIEILWSLHRADLDIEEYSFISELNRLLHWPDITMRGVALRYQAIVKQMSGASVEEIEPLLNESHDLLKKAGARIELAKTQIELARWFVEKGDILSAKKAANIAYRSLTEIDMDWFPSGLLFLVQEQPKEMRLSYGISKLAAATDSLPDYNAYLGKVVTILTDMFGAERSVILLNDGEGSNVVLKIAAARNFIPEELDYFNKNPLPKFISTVLKRERPLIISNLKTNSKFFNLFQDTTPIKSLALLPLVLNESVFGLIYTDNRLLKGVFQKKDLVLMTAIATQITLALKSVSLAKELQHIKDKGRENSFFEKQTLTHKDFPRLIGASKAITDVLNKVRKVADTDATVLIHGETGVGKELIAQSIHHLSRRADGPFIAVNICALNENLLQSELFGYEKGAFTGAERSKAGRFEMADGGTILLDEIGDLSMESQVQLLRVLEQGEFERVGGTRTVRSDFRLIVATNRNLQDMVARGNFRSDLFYRISTFPIHILPLRERKEDIPGLVHHFLKKYSEQHRKKIKSIPDTEMKKLLDYSWPGNIRELEHYTERAVILSANERLTITDFAETRPVSHEKEAPAQTELRSLEEIERNHITSVLDHCRGRIRGEQGAAKILGMKPSTLEYRIKKLAIKNKNGR
ncbi:MAG: sigma 54-interacting transcriptional regulator [Desulfobacterales bacterium]|jgi:transcriptional regulator with GAF, ATPase, and Fis domain/tetratricopeptide (TPR) repeat protein|nr:sigma 54-interacting transcriptional regulator [Desulfobacterales bacterium]